MFDVGFWEVAVIGVVALIIVGPERLPGLVRTTAKWVGKGKRMISDVKRDIDRELKVDEMSDLANVKTEFDKVKKEVKSTTDTIVKQTGLDEVKSSFDDTVKEVSKATELDELDQVAKQVSDELDQAHLAVDQQAEAAANASPPEAAKTT